MHSFTMKTAAVLAVFLFYFTSFAASLPAPSKDVSIAIIDNRSANVERQTDDTLPPDAPRPIFVPVNGTTVRMVRNVMSPRRSFTPLRSVNDD